MRQANKAFFEKRSKPSALAVLDTRSLSLRPLHCFNVSLTWSAHNG